MAGRHLQRPGEAHAEIDDAPARASNGEKPYCRARSQKQKQKRKRKRKQKQRKHDRGGPRRRRSLGLGGHLSFLLPPTLHSVPASLSVAPCARCCCFSSPASIGDGGGASHKLLGLISGFCGESFSLITAGVGGWVVGCGVKWAGF